MLGITLALFAIPLTAQDVDPIIGTWVLNVAKSTFAPGPAPISESQTYVVEEQKTKVTPTGSGPRVFMSVRRDIKATSIGVDSEGKLTNREWTVVCDDKEYPVIGDADADTIASRRIDAFTTEFSLKRSGRIVFTGTRVISKDGTLMTVTASGVGGKGQSTRSVAVFDKQ